MNEISLKTKALELGSNEGEVTIAVNCIGVLDHQNDISMTGSFDKTLKENFPNIRHYLNHDTNTLIGCPIEGKEQNNELVFKTALCLDLEKGREIYALYKLYNKYGNTLQHSIGVTPVKRNKDDKRKVEEWKLHEFSTLTKMGACPGTHLIDIKSLDVANEPNNVISIMKDAIAMGMSEKTKAVLEDQIILIEKALKGDALLVTCPDCGLVFDWNTADVHSIEEDLKREYLEELAYMARNEAYNAAVEQRQEISAEVREMLGLRKSLSEISEYVRCPKCYRRIYKSEIIDFGTAKKTTTVSVEPAKATPTAKAAQEDTFTVKDMAQVISSRYSTK